MLIGVVLLLGCTTLLGLGNTIGFHRLLTHRSFTARGWVRDVLTLLGAMHSGSPLMWVGLHRLHHAKSDGPEDPHSPHAGFWYGHCGWIVRTKNPLFSILFAMSGFGQQCAFFVHDVRRVLGHNPPKWRELCPDLMGLRLMRLLDIPFVTLSLFGLQCVVAFWGWGLTGLLWLWALHFFLTNGSWAVNSFCHWPSFGVERFPNRDTSRNVAWLSVLTFGEAFHNNHHRYPRSAWHSLGDGFDLSWVIIRWLVRLSLAEQPWLPKKYRSPVD